MYIVMSEQNFPLMKSGRSLTTESDTELLVAIQAMVLVFLEDATKMAINYTQAKYPQTFRVADETIVKCLKARVQFGIDLDSQYTNRMQKIINSTKNCTEDERLEMHFNQIFETEEAWTGGEEDETKRKAAQALVVQTVEFLEPKFENWQPTDRFQELLKKAICDVSAQLS